MKSKELSMWLSSADPAGECDVVIDLGYGHEPVTSVDRDSTPTSVQLVLR